MAALMSTDLSALNNNIAEICAANNMRKITIPEIDSIRLPHTLIDEAIDKIVSSTSKQFADIAKSVCQQPNIPTQSSTPQNNNTPPPAISLSPNSPLATPLTGPQSTMDTLPDINQKNTVTFAEHNTFHSPALNSQEFSQLYREAAESADAFLTNPIRTALSKKFAISQSSNSPGLKRTRDEQIATKGISRLEAKNDRDNITVSDSDSESSTSDIAPAQKTARQISPSQIIASTSPNKSAAKSPSNKYKTPVKNSKTTASSRHTPSSRNSQKATTDPPKKNTSKANRRDR